MLRRVAPQLEHALELRKRAGEHRIAPAGGGNAGRRHEHGPTGLVGQCEVGRGAQIEIDVAIQLARVRVLRRRTERQIAVEQSTLVGQVTLPGARYFEVGAEHVDVRRPRPAAGRHARDVRERLAIAHEIRRRRGRASQEHIGQLRAVIQQVVDVRHVVRLRREVSASRAHQIFPRAARRPRDLRPRLNGEVGGRQVRLLAERSCNGGVRVRAREERRHIGAQTRRHIQIVTDAELALRENTTVIHPLPHARFEILQRHQTRIRRRPPRFECSKVGELEQAVGLDRHEHRKVVQRMVGTQRERAALTVVAQHVDQLIRLFRLKFRARTLSAELQDLIRSRATGRKRRRHIHPTARKARVGCILQNAVGIRQAHVIGHPTTEIRFHRAHRLDLTRFLIPAAFQYR